MKNNTRFEYMGFVIQREGKDWVVYDWDCEVDLILKYWNTRKTACMGWIERNSGIYI